MSDNRASNGNLGAALGALIAVDLAIFLLNGLSGILQSHTPRRRGTQ